MAGCFWSPGGLSVKSLPMLLVPLLIGITLLVPIPGCASASPTPPLPLVQEEAVEAPEQEPALIVGRTIRGEITNEEPEVHTDTLDANYTQALTVGRTFELRVEEAGIYHIDLRSYFFDAYIVLRDGAGKVVAEDDDGGAGRVLVG